MRQLYPDLWQTRADNPIPGAPEVNTHAYLLTRDGGNLLFYATAQQSEQEAIAELGGMTHNYLSHRDEVGPHLARLRSRFGSKLVAHEAEREDVETAAPVDILLKQREVHHGIVEVIPTPGHSPGSVCYFIHSPYGQRYLLTGDTIFLNRGRWKTLIFHQEDRKDLIESLQLLWALEPDVVLSSASVGEPSFKEMGPGEWQAAVDEALEGLDRIAFDRNHVGVQSNA